MVHAAGRIVGAGGATDRGDAGGIISAVTHPEHAPIRSAAGQERRPFPLRGRPRVAVA
ncbi:MAG: hypothetical protein JO116_15700 [Planctomycetaceae bacterium]|nr:hypothetical protein [Planctomycetaceae bacterium]